MAPMRMRMIIGCITICVSGAMPLSALSGEAPGGERVFADPENYVANAFSGHAPERETLWPSDDLRSQLTDILGHTPSLRFKYWAADGKTVWVLDEVGKDRPITAGVTIAQDRIEDIQVLVFRETRGWEIKHDFFTRQFLDLWLDGKHRLSDKVDNITGATLSVKAMTRMAKAALLMHQHTPQATGTLANAR